MAPRKKKTNKIECRFKTGAFVYKPSDPTKLGVITSVADLEDDPYWEQYQIVRLEITWDDETKDFLWSNKVVLKEKANNEKSL